MRVLVLLLCRILCCCTRYKTSSGDSCNGDSVTLFTGPTAMQRCSRLLIESLTMHTLHWLQEKRPCT